MATEMITLKLEGKFLKEIDNMVKTENYHNRTEFIRNSLRKSVDETKLKKAMMKLSRLRGKAPVKTSDEERERIREKVVEEFDRKFR